MTSILVDGCEVGTREVVEGCMIIHSEAPLKTSQVKSIVISAFQERAVTTVCIKTKWPFAATWINAGITHADRQTRNLERVIKCFDIQDVIFHLINTEITLRVSRSGMGVLTRYNRLVDHQLVHGIMHRKRGEWTEDNRKLVGVYYDFFYSMLLAANFPELTLQKTKAGCRVQGEISGFAESYVYGLCVKYISELPSIPRFKQKQHYVVIDGFPALLLKEGESGIEKLRTIVLKAQSISKEIGLGDRVLVKTLCKLDGGIFPWRKIYTSRVTFVCPVEESDQCEKEELLEFTYLC